MLNLRKLLQGHLDLVNTRNFKRPLFSIDVETDGLNGPIQAVGIQTKESSLVLRQNFEDLPIPPLSALGFYNGAYDLRQLKYLPSPIMYLDAMAAVYLMDENLHGPSLDEAASKFLGKVPWGSWSADMSDKELEEYLRHDIDATHNLLTGLWPKLADENLLDLWLKVECPMAFVVAEMEQHGVRIDLQKLEQHAKINGEKIELLQNEIKRYVPSFPWGCERCEGTGTYTWKNGKTTSPCSDSLGCGGTGRNDRVWGSYDQLCDLLFNRIGITPSPYTTDGGSPAVDKKALNWLRERSDKQDVKTFLTQLLDLKERSKLQNSFFNPYLEAGSERLYPSWHPWRVVTGRYSCSNPNLMQVPTDIRNLFIADEGYRISKWDYSQLEYYILGVLSGEESIIEAYESGKDVHQITADLAGIERDSAKTVNYGIIYGLSKYSLADRLGCSKNNAAKIQSAVLNTIPKANQWMEAQKKQARTRGYVETALGRRRRLPAANSDIFGKRKHAENQSVNSPVQGTAADIMKAAQVYAYLSVPDSIPIMQIHDELVTLVPEDRAEEAHQEIGECMRVVLKNKGFNPNVEGKLGKEWQK